MKNPIITYLMTNHFLAAIAILAIGWFLLEIKEVLVAFFIAYILMAALLPFKKFLLRKGLPKPLAVSIPFFVTLALAILLVVPLVPFFVSQVQSLIVQFPFLVDKAAGLLGIQVADSQLDSLISSEFDTIGKNAISFTRKVFGGIFSLLTILVLSFYLLVEHERLRQNLVGLFSKSSQEKVALTLLQIEEKLGAWLRGQLVLSLFIGTITWIVLTILGLDFALPLALIAGLLEIVPTIGPIVSAIPAVIVAITVSPTMAITVAVVYMGIQAIENNLLVPKIMEKAVGLNPIVIIMGIIVGGKLLGILGALLSIPFIAASVILYRSLQKQ